MANGKNYGRGCWDMTGIAGAACEHCGGLLAVGNQGAKAFLQEVDADLYTAFDFNGDRVGQTVKRVCKHCVRGTGYQGRACASAATSVGEAEKVAAVADWLMEIDTVRNQSAADRLAALLVGKNWEDMVWLMKSRDMDPRRAERTADVVCQRMMERGW